ncbi:MAG TPA: MFS transporter [Limnochordales bacterium]
MNLIDRSRPAPGRVDIVPGPNPTDPCSNRRRSETAGAGVAAGPPQASLAWRMLAVLIAAVSIGSMGRYAVGPLSPFIIDHYGLSKAQFGALSSAIGLGAIATSYGIGLLIDRLGVRQVMRLGLLTIGVPLVAFFFPVDYGGAAVLLLLSGAGFSAISPLSSNGTASWFPPGARGMTVGFTQAGIPLGVALAGLIMPRLALATGWNAALAILGISVACAGLLLSLVYRDGPLPAAGRGRTAGPDGAARGRVSPWALVREDGMVWLYVLGLVMASTQNSVIAFLVPFIQDRWALPVVTAGALLSVSQFTGMGARPVIGYVSDRFAGGRRKEMLVGIALLASGALVLLAMSPASLPSGVVAVLMVVVGLTTLSWSGLFFALNLEKARPGTAGAASGLAVGVVMTGTLVGPALFGYLVDVATYAAGWLALAAGMAVAAGLFVWRFRERAAAPDRRAAEG